MTSSQSPEDSALTAVSIEATFDRLRTLPPGSGNIRIVEAGPAYQGAMLGIDPEGLRHLLFVSEDPFDQDLASAGVQIRRSQLEDDSSRATYIDVVCLKPHLDELFNSIVSEILETIASDGKAPIAASRWVLNRWRELIAKPASRGLSPTEEAGLFAELLFLRRVVEASHGSVAAWVGPVRGRHDFVGAQLDLEVKASTASHGRPIEVHGLDQLTPFDGTDLCLAFVRLERVPAGGVSIGGLVNEVAVRCADPVEFHSLLHAAGYRKADDTTTTSDQGGTLFRVIEEAVYSVDAAFPRLDRSSFVHWPVGGVTYVNYGVDLVAATASLLSPEEVASVIARLGDRSA